MQHETYFSSDETLLAAQINDAVELCRLRQRPQFVGFLNEQQAVLSKHTANSLGFHNYVLFGGYTGAQRCIFGAFPFHLKEAHTRFPVKGLSFHYRECDVLQHKDFLGTILSLGLKREAVGDILVEKGRAVVFVKEELAEYIQLNIHKVGGAGVNIEYADLHDLPSPKAPELLNVNVSSMRLDGMVSALTGASRGNSAKLIASGMVQVNSFVQQNNSYTLKENDSLTIRKKGKFIINGILGRTRKDRLKVSVKQFK